MGQRRAMLIVLSGLPGVGKTTIAKALARKHAAVFVRVDAIEHALKQHHGSGHDIGAAGYTTAFAVAASNLALGTMVIADCVNPVPESRKGWRDIAHGVPLLEVEIICSDATEHRRRVTERAPDIAGFRLPTWLEVASHRYVAWSEPHLVVDTSVVGIDAAVGAIENALLGLSGPL